MLLGLDPLASGLTQQRSVPLPALACQAAAGTPAAPSAAAASTTDLKGNPVDDDEVEAPYPITYFERKSVLEVRVSLVPVGRAVSIYTCDRCPSFALARR